MGYSTSKQFLASLWMKTKKVLEGEVYKVYRMHREMNVCSSSTEGGIGSGGYVGDIVGSSSSSSVVDCSGIGDSGNHSSNAINDGSSSNICNSYSNITSGNNDNHDNDRVRGKYSRCRNRKQ